MLRLCVGAGVVRLTFLTCRGIGLIFPYAEKSQKGNVLDSIILLSMQGMRNRVHL